MYWVLRTFATLSIFGSILVSSAAPAEDLPPDNDRVLWELAAMGRHGASIISARDDVLAILQTENGCSAWFEEASADTADVFRSLPYELVEGENATTVHMSQGFTAERWKNPWAAMAFEDGGKNSTIQLNTNGAFFKSTSPVNQVGPPRWLEPSFALRVLRVGWFSGDTVQAQITILLHELGHVVGRLPEDGDSWDGRSAENTGEVLRHCRTEIRNIAKIKILQATREEGLAINREQREVVRDSNKATAISY